MQANVLVDVLYQAGQVVLVAYYCSDNHKKAWSLKIEQNGESQTFPVQWVQRTDFEKHHGEQSNVFWYTVSIDQVTFYHDVLNPEAQLYLMDESMNEVPFPVGFLKNKAELETKISAFLRAVNPFVLQAIELERAMAYCLMFQKELPQRLDEVGALALRLWSSVAVSAEQDGWALPMIEGFEPLLALCQREFGADVPMFCAVLMRLACAYNFEYPLLQWCEQQLDASERAEVGHGLLLSVLYLKRLLPLAAETFTETFPNPPAQVSHLFKRVLLNAPGFNFTQADMAEKMAVVCMLYHRIFHFKKGLQTVGFRAGELQNFARRLHLASFGTLGLKDLEDYKIA
jgi:hypothetical protein